MKMLYIISILGLVLLIFNTRWFKGYYGEWQVNRKLKKLAKLYGGLEFHDLMLEDHRSSSQIDNVLLTSKALYVIEVKNYGGYIFGNEENQYWTQTIKHVNTKKSRSGKIYKKTSISKHKFYNPLKQNKTHINKIKSLTDIDDYVPIINIVVFGNRAYLRDVTHSNETYVVNVSQLHKLIKRLETEIEEEISNDNMIYIVEQLFEHNIEDKKRRKEHVKRIRSIHSK